MHFMHYSLLCAVNNWQSFSVKKLSGQILKASCSAKICLKLIYIRSNIQVDCTHMKNVFKKL